VKAVNDSIILTTRHRSEQGGYSRLLHGFLFEMRNIALETLIHCVSLQMGQPESHAQPEAQVKILS
jgi:hypothetical protein